MAERAVEGDPAVVLLAGDFLCDTGPDATLEINTVLDVLKPLTETDVPLFAVMGNHDYAVGAAEQFTTALKEEASTCALRARSRPGTARGRSAPAGRGHRTRAPGLDNAAKALPELPPSATCVVLMHDPTLLLQLPARPAPLAVASHPPRADRFAWRSRTRRPITVPVLAEPHLEDGKGDRECGGHRDHTARAAPVAL